ncbi:RNA chaperone Hfq, partial [Staphylococcus epidermidis]|uniref:RNA chaperone Hfq n=1 Tax=Staphylococcus epidermidis TaxID=1282 RepID=UPI0011A863AF
MIPNQNIQHQPLHNFKSQKTQVTIFFLNPFQIKPLLQNYHKYLLTLNSHPNQHLIYK